MATPNEQVVREHIERQEGHKDDALALALLLIALLDESEPQVRIIIEFTVTSHAPIVSCHCALPSMALVIVMNYLARCQGCCGCARWP